MIMNKNSKFQIYQLVDHFNKTDLITIIYSLINMLYIIYGYSKVEHPLKLIVSFLSIIVFIIAISHFDTSGSLLRREYKKRLIRFLHLWSAPMFFAFFFEATSAVNLVVFKDFLDPFFQRLDYLIFAYQPAMEWGTRWDNYFIQELLHFSYFSYYLMIFGVPFLIYFKRKEEIFKRVVFNISFVFYCCYLIFMVLPVIGGRALEGAFELTVQYRYGIFTHLMAYIYRATPHLGGAFPSSHVAIAVCISLISSKYFKVLPYILFPITFLLSISTVYCHYHYFVDTIAGVIYGAGCYYLSEKLYNKLKVIDKKSKNMN